MSATRRIGSRGNYGERSLNEAILVDKPLCFLIFSRERDSTLEASILLVICREHNAHDAAVARNAVLPCPILPDARFQSLDPGTWTRAGAGIQYGSKITVEIPDDLAPN